MPYSKNYDFIQLFNCFQCLNILSESKPLHIQIGVFKVFNQKLVHSCYWHKVKSLSDIGHFKAMQQD